MPVVEAAFVLIAPAPVVTCAAPTLADELKRAVERVIGSRSTVRGRGGSSASSCGRIQCPAPAVACAASALSSAPTPSERVMLRRQAQEAAGERAAAEKLLAVEAAARPAAKKAKKGKHKK